MKFWSTSETTEDVVAALSQLERKIEAETNKALENFPSDDDKYPKWAVIFVCVSDEFLDFFSETLVSRKKPPAIEHRLQIKHADFLQASNTERLTLMMDVLRRSVNYMGEKKFNIDESRRIELTNLLNTVENKIRFEISD